MKILDILCASVLLVMTVSGFVILLVTPLEEGRYFYLIFITAAIVIGFGGFVTFVDILLKSRSKKGSPNVSSKN